MNPSNVCDKCGEIVPVNNDAVYLDALLNNSVVLLFCQSRHILPTENCPGSPSRAQYLEGQPRDSRYAYYPDVEAIVRSAFVNLQNPDFVTETFGA